MIIFVATLATILLLTKLGAKQKQQLRYVRVKAKRDIKQHYLSGSLLQTQRLP